MGESGSAGRALARVAAAVGGDEVVHRLATLSGSDFTSLMLEVARRRAAAQTPAGVLRRYREDRFVRVADASWQSLRRAEDLLTANLVPEFELLTLAPLVPLGAHSALGPVSQDKVVTALRSCEVAADPTNALALEAATRRIALRAGGTVRRPRAAGRDRANRPGRDSAPAGPGTCIRLAAFQRVARAQRPDRPGYLAHFSLLGLATAGRDDGGRRFERESVAEHVRAVAASLAAAGLAPAHLAITPLSDAGEAIALALPAELAGAPVEVVVDRERVGGRGYYRDLCYKIAVRAGGKAGDGDGERSAERGLAEVGDGGFTDWGARLTASSKERLLISGIGIDRLAAFMQP